MTDFISTMWIKPNGNTLESSNTHFHIELLCDEPDIDNFDTSDYHEHMSTHSKAFALGYIRVCIERFKFIKGVSFQWGGKMTAALKRVAHKLALKYDKMIVAPASHGYDPEYALWETVDLKDPSKRRQILPSLGKEMEHLPE